MAGWSGMATQGKHSSVFGECPSVHGANILPSGLEISLQGQVIGDGPKMGNARGCLGGDFLFVSALAC
jgi:hypothetical protein